MNYDPIEAEEAGAQAAPSDSPGTRTFPEKHNLPHRLARKGLADVLRSLGCNSGSLILDVGCGTGSEDLQYFSEITRNIIGIDVVSSAIAEFSSKGFSGLLADAANLPFRDNTFDCVVCPAVLHHLIGQGDLARYIREFGRVLRPGGRVVALEPNAFNVSGVLMNVANTIKPGITGLVPHERALSPIWLGGVFKKAGLTGIRCTAATFTWNRLPLWVSRAISLRETAVKDRAPFRYFGWFSVVSGTKPDGS